MSPARRGVTEQAADAAIDQACRLLRLPTIRDRFAELADAAKRQQLTYRGFLAELLLAECDDRDRRRSTRRVKEAGFPRPKHLDDFDFDANPNIPAATIHTMASCAWIRNREPLCLIGDSGTGKSHLLIGLGTIAAQQGYRVRYTLAAKLVNELVEAADERHLAKTIARYGRVDLLCIDELGYMELDRRGAELLFQVLTEREERNSVAIASNESFGGWTKTFTDPGCARRSWTGSPSAATSSRPAPAPTGWPTPAANAPPPPPPPPPPTPRPDPHALGGDARGRGPRRVGPDQAVTPQPDSPQVGPDQAVTVGPPRVDIATCLPCGPSPQPSFGPQHVEVAWVKRQHLGHRPAHTTWPALQLHLLSHHAPRWCCGVAPQRPIAAPSGVGWSCPTLGAVPARGITRRCRLGWSPVGPARPAARRRWYRGGSSTPSTRPGAHQPRMPAGGWCGRSSSTPPLSPARRTACQAHLPGRPRGWSRRCAAASWSCYGCWRWASRTGRSSRSCGWRWIGSRSTPPTSSTSSARPPRRGSRPRRRARPARLGRPSRQPSHRSPTSREPPASWSGHRWVGGSGCGGDGPAAKRRRRGAPRPETRDPRGRHARPAPEDRCWHG